MNLGICFRTPGYHSNLKSQQPFGITFRLERGALGRGVSALYYQRARGGDYGSVFPIQNLPYACALTAMVRSKGYHSVQTIGGSHDQGGGSRTAIFQTMI